MNKQQPTEYCSECDEVTGNAGIGEDSIYCEKCDIGPLCSACSDKCPCKMTNPTTEQSDKELAEKVAKKLGLNLIVFKDGSAGYKDDDGLFYCLFSWPTVGLVIAQAREWGWSIELSCGEVSFYIRDNFEDTQTNSYNVDILGDITAILSAFAEIPAVNKTYKGDK